MNNLGFEISCQTFFQSRNLWWQHLSLCLLRSLPFTRTVMLLIFVISDQFCQAVCPILPGSPTNFEIGIFLSLCRILCNSCLSFIWNLWLVIGPEWHKIGQRDRKIPISKVSRTAWQNWMNSKNLTDFGFSCKRGVWLTMDQNY